jgi:hypothetical protein
MEVPKQNGYRKMISFTSAGDNPLWHCVCAEMEAPVEGS